MADAEEKIKRVVQVRHLIYRELTNQDEGQELQVLHHLRFHPGEHQRLPEDTMEDDEEGLLFR